MAPEQFVDFRSVDARADVYSLGLLLFVATTGEKPFTAVTPHEWMMAHALKPLTSIRSIDPDFDSEFADLIERCLAKSPAERPTALDVQAQLESIADRLEAPSAVEISKAATSHHSATTMVAPLTPVRAVATTL